MCGIFGAISSDGSLSIDQAAFIKSATITGQVRGDDGTGWIVHSTKNHTSTFKKAMCGNDFLDCRIGRKAVRSLNTAVAVIGHNRKTTSGGDYDSDCHPYSYDSLVGVHNGGIPPVSLQRLKTDNHVASVDSAKLYAGIDAEDNPIDALKKVHAGSYALAWIDKKNNDLCLARNKDRPLWASIGEDGLYFASEPGMLFWLMSRYALESTASKLFELDPDTLYRINIDDMATYSKTPFEVEAPPVVSHSYPPVNNHNSRKDPWYGNRGRDIHRYVHSCDRLGMSYPGLAYLGDVIQENLDFIKNSYPESGVDTRLSDYQKDRRLDMIVTDVKPMTEATYPDVYGYLQDATDSGLTIPILLHSVKDSGYNFAATLKEAEKKGELFTCRVTLSSIRVAADGSLVVTATIVAIWDEKNNVTKDAGTTAAAKEAETSISMTAGALSSKQIAEMWSKLKAKPNVH